MGPQITPDNAAQQAGILCNDVAFQNYAALRNGFAKGEFNQSKSAEHIRQICKIESRRELARTPTHSPASRPCTPISCSGPVASPPPANP
jgi:hypothetical protein